MKNLPASFTCGCLLEAIFSWSAFVDNSISGRSKFEISPALQLAISVLMHILDWFWWAEEFTCWAMAHMGRRDGCWGNELSVVSRYDVGCLTHYTVVVHNLKGLSCLTISTQSLNDIWAMDQRIKSISHPRWDHHSKDFKLLLFHGVRSVSAVSELSVKYEIHRPSCPTPQVYCKYSSHCLNLSISVRKDLDANSWFYNKK